MTAGIEFRQVTKRYGDAKSPLVVKGIDLVVPKGTLTTILGPSGCGKTTSLRMIAGLDVASSGQILIDGQDVTALGAAERNVSMVFQSYALFPHMSVIGNVGYGLEVSGLGREETRRRARAAMELVGLAGYDDRSPSELSGGQQQRVAVARALARDPRVLLLDEPFSAVDRSTRQILYRELATLRRDLAMPVVLVTHDLDEAAMLADRMSILHRGRTLQAAPPHELMARPANSLVARLVDLKNGFAGSVLAHDEASGVTFVEGFGQRLECRLDARFAPGAKVHWAIPGSHVILHRRDRPSRGERENPVRGAIADFLPLGENVSTVIRVEGTGESLRVTFPLHVARRNGLEAGAEVVVSLLREGIHLMPD